MYNTTQYSIGIVGMGWVGGSYARDFLIRGYKPVCYSLEFEYVGNKDKIKDCDIVFICVPTPTTPNGFDDSIVRNVIQLVGKGKIAVIKSTMIPGTTSRIQSENPEKFITHSPEFLTESSALHDTSSPTRNIIGIPMDNTLYREKAEAVLSVLSRSLYNVICGVEEAELIKYARNIMGYIRVTFYNILYDITKIQNADWQVICEAIGADPDNGPAYTNPIHKGGRGAGGNCFIKDFAAFVQLAKKVIPGDIHGIRFLEEVESKNKELLTSSKKDLELLKGVYGEKSLEAKRGKI